MTRIDPETDLPVTGHELDETAEENYRRGYCDGYIIANGDSDDDSATHSDIACRMFQFWERNLTDWKLRVGNGLFEPPPDFKSEDWAPEEGSDP